MHHGLPVLTIARPACEGQPFIHGIFPPGSVPTRRRPLEYHPLTAARWSDFERVMGPQGGDAGCWCMWWRYSASEYRKKRGAGNKRAIRSLARKGPPPGILTYKEGEPVGWCSVRPRDDFPRMDQARTLKRIDDEPVWSVGCLLVAKGHRRQGLTVRLLWSGVDYALSQGAEIVEGYPVEPKSDNYPIAYAWTGIASTFRKAGFIEVARPGARPIMRYTAPKARRRAAERTRKRSSGKATTR